MRLLRDLQYLLQRRLPLLLGYGLANIITILHTPYNNTTTVSGSLTTKCDTLSDNITPAIETANTVISIRHPCIQLSPASSIDDKHRNDIVAIIAKMPLNTLPITFMIYSPLLDIKKIRYVDKLSIYISYNELLNFVKCCASDS